MSPHAASELLMRKAPIYSSLKGPPCLLLSLDCSCLKFKVNPEQSNLDSPNLLMAVLHSLLNVLGRCLFTATSNQRPPLPKTVCL